MSALVHARVTDLLVHLRLGAVAERLDALLSEAARTEPTYLDFLDLLLREESGSKQRKRVAMGIQIAHFPAIKTLEEFDFKFQPSLDAKLIRELATGRYIPLAENLLLFGPPGVGKTHLATPLAAPRSRRAIRRSSSEQRRSWPPWPRRRARGGWPSNSPSMPSPSS